MPGGKLGFCCLPTFLRMRAPDLARWAIIGFKDDTGLGRMSADLRALLAPIRFLVLPSRRLAGQPLAAGEIPFDANASDADLDGVLSPLEGVIFFEAVPHPALLATARRRGVATVCVPMWEWFNPAEPSWPLCSLFICPNEICRRVLERLGLQNLAVLPWPIDLRALPRRQIAGPARTFVHNAGLFEPDDRKGTRLAMEAFRRVKLPTLRLIVRSQNALPFDANDPRIEVRTGNLPRHGDLYAEGDTAIQPSKAEGLGFAILEAVASGMPVITTDYPPMNESVQPRALLAGTRWGKQKTRQSSYIPQACFKTPRLSSLARRIDWCARHDLTAISAANLAWARETFDRERLRLLWMDKLGSLPR
jgi:glycosyltransferase involved in cell wall biosynthesis